MSFPEPQATAVGCWGAIVVAAGHGTRFGSSKALVPIAGRPMVAWPVTTFAGISAIEILVIVTEVEHLENMREIAREFAPGLRSAVVRGGPTRQHSVNAGLVALAAFGDPCDRALVHDGARPLIAARDVRAAMALVAPGRAAIVATPVVDTIKRVRSGIRGELRIAETLDRSALWAAETPQLALLADFQRAHREAERDRVAATDDAALLERSGIEVCIVPASSENFKVTHPIDRDRAEALLLERISGQRRMFG